MNDVKTEKSFEFSVKVLRVVREARNQNHEYDLLNQLLRAATSVGANIAESIYAQSGRDFISKLSIARKEAGEAKYWIRLFGTEGLIDKQTARELYGDAEDLIRVLTAIIKTKSEHTE